MPERNKAKASSNHPNCPNSEGHRSGDFEDEVGRMRLFVMAGSLLTLMGCRGSDRSPIDAATLVAEPVLLEASVSEERDGSPVSESSSSKNKDAGFTWTGPDIETMPWQEVMKLDGSVSTSIGRPNKGRVVGGVPFPLNAPGLRLNPRRFNKDGHYGTVEMIQSLIRAAAVVERELPGGSGLVINDLGFETGGKIPHHSSHQAGRDVDVLFYMFDADGEPQPSNCVSLNLEGRGWDYLDPLDPEDDVFFKRDGERSWRFLQALAEQEETTLQRVFVAEHIRTLLLTEADRVKAPRAARELVEAVTCQPNSPHDDHFHIRFFCTPQDIRSGCRDSWPMFPWRVETLREQGIRPPVFSRPRYRRGSARADLLEKILSKGPTNDKVKAFLEERRAWRNPPKTDRPFCP